MQNNRKSTEGQKGDNWGEERETWYKKYKNKSNEETSESGSRESIKRRNIGWRSTNDLQWWKK